jgi:hypothetical protein
MLVCWLHTTICKYYARLKFRVTISTLDELPGHQIEDTESEATQEALTILVGLTDGGK